ncbi:MAG: hypothetical protein JST90_03200 [Bacteroidetes bacterium]|nr:hypothetical protein [Bacteroidota bacterium]
MAVWVFAYGKNNLYDEIGEDETKYLDTLKNVEIDARKILKSLDETHSYLRGSGQYVPKSNCATDSSHTGWEKHGSYGFRYSLPNVGLYDTIRCARINDLIWVTGPWDIFSVYGSPQSVISPESLDFYHDSFKRIMLAFDSDFIVYGHEWSSVYGSDDNNDFNSNDLMHQIRSAGKSSDSIHTMQDFYFEQLSTR